MRKMTYGEFLSRSIIMHSNAYDYSKVVFSLASNKITIGCLLHGDFDMLRGNHLKGQGCPVCGKIKNISSLRHTNDDFIQKSKNIHGKERYDYSYLTEYTTYTSNNKVKLKCNSCGDIFETLPSNHIHNKSGCMCNVKGGIDDKYFINHPEQKSKPAILYHVIIYNDNEVFYKVGITTKSIKERFSKLHKFGYEYKTISSHSTSLYEAYKTEQEFLEKRKLKYWPKVKFDGWTECYQ